MITWIARLWLALGLAQRARGHHDPVLWGTHLDVRESTTVERTVAYKWYGRVGGTAQIATNLPNRARAELRAREFWNTNQ
ncbi:hypothetical protein A2U01_0058959 [Trifolium medium]|uniref:Uncharacterized protein n=1 Tax=Trifolium medium TaxID=97028 RepID=A0A392RM86_9FABA|nr:hypothetical protein [Trifolium medium]